MNTKVTKDMEVNNPQMRTVILSAGLGRRMTVPSRSSFHSQVQSAWLGTPTRQRVHHTAYTRLPECHRMQFPRWLLLVGLVAASSFVRAQQQMRVASSVPLPDLWKRLGNAAWASCGRDSDFLLRLVSGSPEQQPHELAHIAANGALLGSFDLHQTAGFEKGTIVDATLDSAGKIVVLNQNVISAGVERSDDEGRPRRVSYRMEHDFWVLTFDDTGKLLNKFSFTDRVAPALRFALFRSGNVLVVGNIFEGQHGELRRPAAIVFSPASVVVANLKLPVTASRMQEVDQLYPLAGDGDELFLAHAGAEAYLLKVSADGTVGPKVTLAVPQDERASVEKIAGHHALASIAPAERMPPGTITKAPEWNPKAVFDTESGALVETLTVPQREMGPVCYSESGMTFIRTPKGTLDSLIAKPATGH